MAPALLRSKLLGAFARQGTKEARPAGLGMISPRTGILLAQTHRNTNEKGLPQSFRQE